MVFEGNKLMKKIPYREIIRSSDVTNVIVFSIMIKEMPLEVKILMLSIDLQLYK